MMIPVLGVLNLSIDNLLAALVILIIALIILVAVWKLAAPYLGQFAGLVMALGIALLIFILAKVFGIL